MDTRPAPIAWSPDLDAAVHRSFLKNVMTYPLVDQLRFARGELRSGRA